MKKIHLFLITWGLLFTSCSSPIVGEGNADLAQDFIVTDFSNLQANGLFKLLLIESDSTYVSVQSHRNLIENMNISNSGATLKIEEKEPVDGFESYEVYVYYSQPIENIQIGKKVLMQAGGKLRSETLKLDVREGAQLDECVVETKELKISANKKAEVTLSGNTIALDIDTQDMAKVDLENLQARTLRINMANESTAQVNVESEMEGRLLDNSKLEYKGNPKKDVDVKDRAVISNL